MATDQNHPVDEERCRRHLRTWLLRVRPGLAAATGVPVDGVLADLLLWSWRRAGFAPLTVAGFAGLIGRAAEEIADELAAYAAVAAGGPAAEAARAGLDPDAFALQIAGMRGRWRRPGLDLPDDRLLIARLWAALSAGTAPAWLQEPWDADRAPA